MSVKLVLDLEPSLIENAKSYAMQSNKTISELVADYFAQLNTSSYTKDTLPPLTRQLTGSLKGIVIDDKQEYHAYLEKKYL